MLVMDAITEILKREGISTMFCFPTTPIIEAAVAGGMRPVICRQERVGVHMADGCARVTNGKPAGVFAMQYGPGAENAFAGIASAYSDSTPLLLIPLGHPRETATMWPLFNSTRTYESVIKARFSEVCGAVDNEISAVTAAVRDGTCAQLSRAIDTGEAQWDRRHAALWPT
jgi:acetolactate synthase I/II/III large subunit